MPKGSASRFTVRGGNKAQVREGCLEIVDNAQNIDLLLLKAWFL